MEALSVYIPIDRRQALAVETNLPSHVIGAALFADISGFTPLTEGLVRALGPQRGAEEITRHLNIVYDALIRLLHRYGGSVISFSGDAITCWFNGDKGLRAITCALEMQEAMAQFRAVPIQSGEVVSLAMKASVVGGNARRFLVGDPNVQVMDVLAGSMLDQLAKAEHQAEKGEVVLDAATIERLGSDIALAELRIDEHTGERFGVVKKLNVPVFPSSWPRIPKGVLSEADVRPWLLPAVYERLKMGRGDFLAEIRPTVALFLRFSGIDYDEDPAAGEKLDAYVRWIQGILNRYEASLLQVTIGDKGSSLYGAFGAPIAHEDDAVRACAAALELRELPESLNYIRDVQIGISQGRMRTGAYGGEQRRTYGVLGDEVNLAARLMQAAAPGQILASKVTKEATADGFNWDPLPDIRVKGKAHPVTVFSLVERRRRRTMRLTDKYAVPMVGRQDELALIMQKLMRAASGHGEIVALSAEAGMGKSRLVAEIIQRASDQNWEIFVGECQSYGMNTSYLVWQNIWRTFFNLDATWTSERQIGALEEHLMQVDPGLLPRLPLLGAVINLQIPDNELTGSLDTKLRKTALESLLVDYVRAQATKEPIIIVLEDCQWLDPLSHDLLEAIGRAVVNLPVFIMMAYRPLTAPHLQAPRVSRLPHFTEIHLSEFTNEEAELLIQQKLGLMNYGGARLPRKLVNRILERAEGNPFYVEELINYLYARQIDLENSQALNYLDFPANLHSLVLGRIDQLTESQKTTLKVASVVGRLFRAAMLWGVYPELGEERVKSDLDALNRVDLTAQEQAEPELSYLFKHIITQEVAYESLPFATRAALHEAIGQYIEREYADLLSQYVDLLAFHYGLSDNIAKKQEYLLKAGIAAQADYANAAAIDYYTRVLPLLPDTDKIDVLIKLGKVLELVGRVEEEHRHYEEALALATQYANQEAQAWCETALGEYYRKRGDYARASSWLSKAEATFTALDHQAGIGQVLHNAGTLAAHQGKFEEARTLYNKSLEVRRELNDQNNIGSLLSNLGIIARLQGNLEQARFLHEAGLRIRREVGDRYGIANSLNNLGNVLLDLGEYAKARERLEEAMVVQREVGYKWAIANTLNNVGNIVRTQGDYVEAQRLYNESLEINRELEDKRAIAYVLEDMAQLAVLDERPQRALTLVSAAATLRGEVGSPLSDRELAQLEAGLAAARGMLDEEAQVAAKAAGAHMSLDEVAAFAMENTLTLA